MQVEATTRPRVKVERGIAYRERASGRRYEFCYQDSDGRWRWLTVDGGLREARQARADMLSKLGRGERVAPTRRTFADFADAWLAGKVDLRPRTRQRYEELIRLHLKPTLGARRLAQLDEDDVVALIAKMREGGSSAGTITKAIALLSVMLNRAVRRGAMAHNPVRRLERGERPTADQREMRTLDRGEITRLLEHAPDYYRCLLATALFTGLRLGELLGLTWADVDFDAGLVHVRKQLDRWKRGELPKRVAPKTPQAIRDVVLMPALAELLREHRESALATGRARRDDYVFASLTGGPLQPRNVVRRGLDKAVERAGLGAADRPSLRFHDLRHTFASLLIAERLNVVFVSRQIGHADPSITLRVYAHLFDQAEHADGARRALEAGFGAALVKSQSSSGGHERENEPAREGAEIHDLQAIRDQREPGGTAAAR